MRVILGADALRPPLTGIGNYAAHMLEGLATHPDIEQLQCLYGRHLLSPSMLTPLLTAEPTSGGAMQQLGACLRQKIRGVPGCYPLHTMWRNSATRHVMYHSPPGTIYHELSYILRPYVGCSITTIHDLSWVHYPQHHPRERVKHMERELPRTLRQAAHIVTDAEYVKNELISILGVDPSRITAIPLGVGEQFHPRTPAQLAPVLRKHGLQSGYILAVATLEPRKNLDSVLAAYRSLSPLLRQQFPLVLAGGSGWKSHALERKITAMHNRGELRRLGYISATDLPFIYAGAAAFVFPSLYEGFGLPPLEAMASGTPVITSSATVMEEVTGSAAMLVSATATDQLAHALEHLLGDAHLRNTLRAKGLERARRYSWHNCIEASVALYRRVSTDFYGA